MQHRMLLKPSASVQSSGQWRRAPFADTQSQRAEQRPVQRVVQLSVCSAAPCTCVVLVDTCPIAARPGERGKRATGGSALVPACMWGPRLPHSSHLRAALHTRHRPAAHTRAPRRRRPAARRYRPSELTLQHRRPPAMEFSHNGLYHYLFRNNPEVTARGRAGLAVLTLNCNLHGSIV